MQQGFVFFLPKTNKSRFAETRASRLYNLEPLNLEPFEPLNAMQTTALIIFIITYIGIIFTRLPRMKTTNSEVLRLALASASTLAGNATIIGAMANLIVIETAESKGVKIRFMEFFRIGIVVTIISMLLSFGIIYLQMSVL